MGGSRLTLALFAALLAQTASAQELPPPYDRAAPTGDPPSVPADKTADRPEPLGRGPLHEGYAQPYDSTPRPAPVVPKAPPPAVREVPPENKPDGDGVVWLPGYWMWDDDRDDFVWVSGFWRVPPPGRQWVPGSWVKADGGYRWASGYWAATGQPAAPPTETPPASLDIGPNQPSPGDGYQWAQGCWIARDERWFWRPGFWVAPQAGWVYSPARHFWTPRGFVYNAGYWDRDLAGRGQLFAPVYLPPGLRGSAFTPSYAVSVSGALGSLWARPGWGYYAYGDYYGASYARLGYQPWFRYATRARDPLFGYYQQANVGRNPNWAAGLATTYNGRVDGTLPRPPRVVAATRAGSVSVGGTRNPALPLVRTPPGQRSVSVEPRPLLRPAPQPARGPTIVVRPAESPRAATVLPSPRFAAPPRATLSPPRVGGRPGRR